jgi:hypothetical protein
VIPDVRVTGTCPLTAALLIGFAIQPEPVCAFPFTTICTVALLDAAPSEALNSSVYVPGALKAAPVTARLGGSKSSQVSTTRLRAVGGTMMGEESNFVISSIRTNPS